MVFGTGSSDGGTIASHLQLFLNENAGEHQFAVHNYGFFLRNTDRLREMLMIMKSLPLQAGDIVICHEMGHFRFNFLQTDFSAYGQRPHNFGELFFDKLHYTTQGNLLIAALTYKYLAENNFFANKPANNTQSPGKLPNNETGSDYGFSPDELSQLEAYKAALSDYYTRRFGNAGAQPRVGSIVMNCNPFTLGHRYLIRQAARQVDLLVVFVVEEDKSYFSFEDRLNMVIKGTADLPNVVTVRGGKFMISSLTFSEYFNKAEIQEQVINCAADVTLFAKEIAPAMNITVRFAGSEPLDKITKQYNDTLSVILPRHGIEFAELERAEKNGKAISASLVRALLDARDWNGIREIVPKTTFEYLQSTFKQDVS